MEIDLIASKAIPLQLQLQKVNIEHWIIGYEDWFGPRTSYIPFRSLLLNATEA